MGRVRQLLPAGLALAIAFSTTACVRTVGPARTFDDYERKAKDTAESVLSSVQTARLGARVGSDGDAFGPYVSVLLSESETGAAHAASVFASIQPPDAHADHVRRRLRPMLDAAEQHLADLRIAARRGDLDRLARVAEPLDPLAHRLERFVARHE
jgi:hypothetical protein